MGLSTRERQALTSIEGRLTQSDHKLASLLGMFTRLTAGEALPARENIRARHPSWQLVVPLLWLAISIGLIAVALAVGHDRSASAAPRLSPVGVSYARGTDTSAVSGPAVAGRCASS